MDAIIRAAALSSVAFELRRPASRATPSARASATPPAPTVGAAPMAAEALGHTTAPPTPAGNSLPAQAAPAAARPSAAAPFKAPAVHFAAAAAPLAASVPAAPSAAAQEAARLAVQAELAELRADAERRGYAAGQEKGESDARRQLQSQIERFQTLAARMVQAKASVLEDGEDGLVELAYAAVCRILGEQAVTREGVLAMVRQCAIATRDREQVGVRLHPDDFAQLGNPALHQVRFSADPAVALGGCMVDSTTGTLDARLETQLSRLAATLLEVRAARHGPEEAL